MGVMGSWGAKGHGVRESGVMGHGVMGSGSQGVMGHGGQGGTRERGFEWVRGEYVRAAVG